MPSRPTARGLTYSAIRARVPACTTLIVPCGGRRAGGRLARPTRVKTVALATIAALLAWPLGADDRPTIDFDAAVCEVPQTSAPPQEPPPQEPAPPKEPPPKRPSLRPKELWRDV